MQEIKLSESRIRTREKEVLNYIKNLPKGTEFYSYQIAAVIVNPRNKKIEANYRQFLTKFLKELIAQPKPIIKFIGWKDSKAPVKMKVYERV